MKKGIYHLLFLLPGLSLMTMVYGISPDSKRQGSQNTLSSEITGSGENNRKMTKEDTFETIMGEEQEKLVYIREEEKLARDVYRFLYDKWGLIPFRNISRSEQVHMNAVGALLETYSIQDPVSEDIDGVFTNPALQTLYTELTKKGEESVEAALKVGTLIEEKDIYDLQQALDSAVVHQDVHFILENLKRGSTNHLRAFVGNLHVRDITYTPVILDMDSYNNIINDR